MFLVHIKGDYLVNMDDTKKITALQMNVDVLYIYTVSIHRASKSSSFLSPLHKTESQNFCGLFL